MAAANHDRVGRALDLLRAGLAPFMAREVTARAKAQAVRMDAIRRFAEDPALADRAMAEWDASGLLRLMWETWNDVFRNTLGFTERSLVSELRGWRDKWAQQERFSSDDADRALDSAERLLAAVSAPQAGEVAKIKMELRRLVFDEQVRGERRRAEFAADLRQVHPGEGADEYRDPHEFFRRTFLTESLKGLLTTAERRLAGRGGGHLSLPGRCAGVVRHAAHGHQARRGPRRGTAAQSGRGGGGAGRSG